MNTHWQIKTPEDFQPLISALLAECADQERVVICLHGELGAGKTTFTQELGKYLGVQERITSPTFGIMNRYEVSESTGFDQLVHIDAYRIEHPDEVGPLRLEELFTQPRTIFCVEWPENIAEILPSEKVTVRIEIGEGEERTVIVQRHI